MVDDEAKVCVVRDNVNGEPAVLGNVLRCIEGEKGEQEASHRKHTDRANWRKRGGDLK